MPGVVRPISIAKIASGSSVNESTLSVPGLAPGEKIPPGWTTDVTGDVAVAAENGAVLNSDVAEPGAGTGEVFDEEFASGDNPWQTDQSPPNRSQWLGVRGGCDTGCPKSSLWSDGFRPATFLLVEHVPSRDTASCEVVMWGEMNCPSTAPRCCLHY